MSTAIIAASATTAFGEAHTSETFRSEATPMDIHASEFIGMRVYTAENPGDAYEGVQTEWDDIGEINDVVLSRDGTIDAVLVDIGGFLGIGERQIAVNMKAIKFVGDNETPDDDSDFFLVMDGTRAVLEEAPEYSWSKDDSMEMTSEKNADSAMTSREGFATVRVDTLTTEELTGASVYDAQGNWIGEVSELIMEGNDKIDRAIVDVGGFLGMGEKPVAMAASELEIMTSKDGDEIRVHVNKTKEQLEEMATYEK
ncbi:PRC-barrel domain-containing protein [Arenibacterium sp. CAU 1754]